ncbi:MAG TPA: methyltransferase domain-containing protein [Candidatus Microsaccharimonas sp.]|jgi:SAM-dependent methyltransferase
MSYKYLLMPGRHQAITRFQVNHLKEVLARPDVDRSAQVIWAVTSANHAGTQRNPISGSRRLGMIEAVVIAEDIPSQVFRITNMTAKPNFAHYVVEGIRLESKGRTSMRPEDTIVICSTKEVAQQYSDAGFQIDSAEVDASFEHQLGPRPWDVVEELIKSGPQWRSSAIVQDELHPVCLAHFERYGLGDDIVEVFQDPLIDSDDGDITTTRDYATYRQAFEDGAIRKVAEFGQYVQAGRILDVGCATGETLKILAKRPDLFESDFYGVEAARPLFQICQQRKDNGEFGAANVFFYQRNIMRSSLFPHNSLNTIITMALTHEIESYLGRDALKSFIQRMYDITAPGGVYINYDVIGPDDKDKMVYALLKDDDGDNPHTLFPDMPEEALASFLRTLSTKARFHRFVKDFRSKEGDVIAVRYETIDDKEYAVLRHADLCDFLAKKDYFDSWHSEMHERFCFWEYADWTQALTEVGFEIGEGSGTKQNTWLIENRFEPAAKVYEKKNDTLVEIEQPVTNVLLIARKPL